MLQQVVTAMTRFNVACVVIVLLGLYCPITESEELYPDLVTQDASTCWETNVFATTNDPIYKWVQSSSLDNALGIDSDIATAAYQRATIWRTNSKEQDKSASDVKLFSSPDVRILGGVIKQYSSSWIWKMKISWGMSVRVCRRQEYLSTASSCTWTAPAVYTHNNELGLIMVKVPYGMPSSSDIKENFPSHAYGGHGYFLMNFAGNARSNMSLGLGMKKVPPLNSSGHGDHWFRYQVGIHKCSQTTPILYVPDIASYMAYPFLQCACLPSTRVCLIGVNMTQTSEPNKTFGPFVFSEERCASTRSFWFWDFRDSSESENSSSIPFSSYNPKLDKYVLLNVAFYGSPSNFNDTTITGLMNNVTMCVENLLENQENGTVRLVNDCKGQLAELGILRYDDQEEFFDTVPEVVLDSSEVMDIVNARISIPRNASDVACGIEEGQAASELDICFLEYKLQLQGLEGQLNSFAEVTDVDIHRFGDDLWKKGSSKRSGVYFAIVTTLLALAVAIATSFSNTLEKGEGLLFKRVHFLENSAVFRTLLRSGIILGTVVPTMFPLFQSFKDIEVKRTRATSGSIQEQIQSDLVFLVTTTSTVEVHPYWIVFIVFTSLLAACIIIVVVFIYVVWFPRSTSFLRLHPKETQLRESGT